jgi:two-component system alkaline phosphatase synthesis response regulator PhoP
MSAKILVVEDEKALRIALSDRLRSEEYLVECAADGEDGFQKSIRGSFDLIILDVMLPRKTGLDVCRDIRKAGLVVPIIMLTARSELVDKVLGLKIGADDYVTKPFEMMELLARVEAHLRNPPQAQEDLEAREFGSLLVDLRGTSVRKNGRPVSLSAREFQLLRYFVQHPNTTLSREVLLKEVWGFKPETFTRTVDVHVACLRQKLEKDPHNPSLFVTVLGLGYKFSP